MRAVRLVLLVLVALFGILLIEIGRELLGAMLFVLLALGVGGFVLVRMSGTRSRVGRALVWSGLLSVEHAIGTLPIAESDGFVSFANRSCANA